MAKLKLNKFEGIFTNIDQNDLKLELFQDSVNFRHEYGYVKFEPRNLKQEDLPNVDNHMGDAPDTWTWENGIYAILVNDPHYFDPSPAQYKCLILIAKKYTGGVYSRTVWLQWIEETPTPIWYELSAEGNYSDIDMPRATLETTIDGDAKITTSKGVVKLYLPHDSFWIGYRERKRATITSRTVFSTGLGSTNFYFFSSETTVTPSASGQQGFYIDRLVEKLKLQSTNSLLTLTLSGTAGLVDLNDEDLRLRILGNFGATLVTAASDDVKFKYKKVRRDWIGLHNSDQEFVFKKVSEGGTDLANQEFIGPNASYDNKYVENSTGAETIAAYPASYGYLSDMTRLPADVVGPEATYYGDEGHCPNNTLLYYYERIAANSFAGPTDILITATLDRNVEIVIDNKYLSIIPADPTNPTEDEEYFITYDMSIPTNINNRITDIKMYIREYYYDSDESKWTHNVDYSLYKSIDLLYKEGDNEDIDLFGTITNSDNEGILLSQNIGILYDFSTYEIITGFKDINIEQEVGLGITYNDYINVYYSTVGGGVIQSDLIYKANKLTLPGSSYVSAVIGLNGNFLVLTETNSYVVRSQEVAGVLAFTIQDTLEYGVKDNRDIATSGAKVFINTKNGIFATDGYKYQLISQNINDICKANFTTSVIQYNRVIHELYYRPTTSEDTYRYRFDRGVWEKLDLTLEVAEDK